MLRIATFFLVLSYTSAFNNRKSPACVSEFQTLNACLDNNTECSDCAVLGPMSNLFSSGFCDVANDSMCNAFGCCPPCEKEFETYEICFAELVAKVTFGKCEVDCELAPTPAPSPSPPPTTLAEAAETVLDEELAAQGCLDHFMAFSECAAKNPMQCGACLVSSIPGDPTEIGFCTAASDAICGFGTCCEPCQAEFIEFDKCFEVIVEDITFGQCTIDCDNYEPKQPLDTGCIKRMQNYTTCLAENPLECAPCAILNFPSDPRENGFCEVATDSICGFSKCCKTCDEQFQEFDECFEDWVSTATVGRCKIDCDTYEGSTTGGGSGCVASLQSYTDCVLSNPLECARCVIANLPNVGDNDFCKAAEDSVCGFGDCCSPCTNEFDEFDDCFESFASTVTLGDCKIDCDPNTAISASMKDVEDLFGARALRGKIAY